MIEEDLLSQMTEILLSNIDSKEHPDVDLESFPNPYREAYFDYLDEKSVKEVTSLFPEGDRLLAKYERIMSEEPLLVTNDELCHLVEKYLRISRRLMEDSIEGQAMDFIDELEAIEIADTFPEFSQEKPNRLYNASYGVFGSWLTTGLPSNDSDTILWQWATDKTKSTVATAYFLEDFLNVEKDTLEPGFLMWKSGNAKSFWAKDNDLMTDTVFCKSVSDQ